MVLAHCGRRRLRTPATQNAAASRARRALAACGLLALLGAAALGGRQIVVLVPGVTGTMLRDPARSHRVVWGTGLRLLVPRDRGWELVLPIPQARGGEEGGDLESEHPQGRYQPAGALRTVRLLCFRKQIYRPFAVRLEELGYREGSLERPGEEADFFFFDYDWRRDNLAAVAALDGQLERLAGARAPRPVEVALVCQSNAGRICRYLAKYGSLSLDQAERGVPRPEPAYHLDKVILVGTSNAGSLRILEQLDRGRRYIPWIGRRIAPETLFSLRPLFEDLPVGRHDLFFDQEGKTLRVDLLDPDVWVRHGWAIFDPAIERRLSTARALELFGSREDRIRYLSAALERSTRLHALLARDVAEHSTTRYYLIENTTRPTQTRALIVDHEKGVGRPRTYYSTDRRLRESSTLSALASTPGDGHATAESQRALSPEEWRALARPPQQVDGDHFTMLILPAGLQAIAEFLAD